MSTTTRTHSHPASDVRPKVTSLDPLRVDQAHATKHASTLEQEAKRSSDDISLESLSRDLKAWSETDRSLEEVLAEVNRRVSAITNAIWVGYAQHRDQSPVDLICEHNALAAKNLGLRHESVLPTIGETLKRSRLTVARIEPLTIISVPVAGPIPGALAMAIQMESSVVEPFVLVGQLVASYLERFHERCSQRQLSWQADATAAIAELTSELAGARNRSDAAMIAANRLADFLDARCVAIGRCARPGNWSVTLDAISGVSNLDRQSDAHSVMRRVLTEAVTRHSMLGEPETRYPTETTEARLMNLAHQDYARSSQSKSLISLPLITSDGRVIGAWTCSLNHDDAEPNRFARVATRFLADALDVADRANDGVRSRLLRKTRAVSKSKNAIASILIIAGLGGLLAVPVPHRIRCSTVLQPVSQRFAVAPFDGVLLESSVERGDFVEKGQVLATMDGVELELELADLIAQHSSASTQRDVSRSASDASATQLANLEMKQLSAQIELLQHRRDHLSITSPTSGVVLQGDLEEANGSPVRKGDVLMQIAPLDSLRAEIAIPVRDLRHVQLGATTKVFLTGIPEMKCKGSSQGFVQSQK